MLCRVCDPTEFERTQDYQRTRPETADTSVARIRKPTEELKRILDAHSPRHQQQDHRQNLKK